MRLVIDTLERQAESCINAVGRTVSRILETGGFAAADLTDDPEAPDGLASISSAALEQARNLLIAVDSLPDDDPKFDQLLEIVSTRLDDPHGPGKALVFSFFLNTIDYLEQRLTAAGVRVGVVTGRIADEDREELRDRFRLDRRKSDAIDVLLSSEVGCEGLDYEFCDSLVNYDIPWNPMRIEQRIGRIDRFGQRSDKVLIFNFITPGTVAERVFFRCFERLGVFRDTVGDLEEVLGEITHDLSRTALDPSLSPEQVQARPVRSLITPPPSRSRAAYRTAPTSSVSMTRSPRKSMTSRPAGLSARATCEFSSRRFSAAVPAGRADRARAATRVGQSRLSGARPSRR